MAGIGSVVDAVRAVTQLKRYMHHHVIVPCGEAIKSQDAALLSSTWNRVDSVEMLSASSQQLPVWQQ